MSSEEMVSKEEFHSLRADVKEIKIALLGNKVFGQKGYLKRLEDLEGKVEKHESFKQKLIYWTAGASAAATIAINIIIAFWK